jgi:cytochrome c-type biogenesis protein CcmH/NrfG
MEDYGKAEKFLLEAIAKNDKDAEAAYILGRTYVELKNVKSAIPQFQKQWSWSPAEVNGFMN